jgi:methylated-DNA-protein-cysteine methyltransferase related protein
MSPNLNSLNKYRRIFQFVRSIPKGKVATYGQIAKSLNLKSSRLVGYALHHNPDPQNIPCHRVVFATGSLSKSYAFGGEIAQKKQLQHEGIIFNKRDQIDLSRFSFRPDTISFQQ